jgi:hypothetical protein
MSVRKYLALGADHTPDPAEISAASAVALIMNRRNAHSILIFAPISPIRGEIPNSILALIVATLAIWPYPRLPAALSAPAL